MSDILLVGQPNVGKSALFARLTGVNVIVSNYPGTTVTYTEGKMDEGERKLKVVDAPGVYSLEPMDYASRVTLDLLDEAEKIINVIDSTHLERNLPLTLELKEQGKSLVIALNMMDEAKHKGIDIDIEKLEKYLSIPVIPIVAKTGEGITELLEALKNLKVKKVKEDTSSHPDHHPHISQHKKIGNGKTHKHLDSKKVWEEIGKIISDVQSLKNRKHTFLELLEDWSIHPVFGFFIAVFLSIVVFAFVRFFGESLVYILELGFEKFWLPVLNLLSNTMTEGSFFYKVLIGTKVDGVIDFETSFGLLSSGLFIPIAVVFPYIISFYIILSLLEDTGYLPRFAVFLDSFMHKVGLHGYAIIPNFLGLGCNVPGILATRVLEDKKQRFIAATLISIGVPCASLQAMIFGLLGEKGILPVLIVYMTLLIVWLVVGIILKYIIPGDSSELLLEFPSYRVPLFKNIFLKVWSKIKHYFVEALPLVVVSIFVVNILYHLNVFNYIIFIFKPVINKLWGMPDESIVPLVIGLIRKDVAIGMLGTMGLSIKQLIIGCVSIALFFPCVATFIVLYKELGFKYTVRSVIVMIITVTLVGTILNLIL